jgi:hypothetical protein
MYVCCIHTECLLRPEEISIYMYMFMYIFTLRQASTLFSWVFFFSFFLVFRHPINDENQDGVMHSDGKE